MKTIKSFVIGAVLICLAGGGVFAEISPKYYKQMQDGATEQLQIKPTSVAKDWFFWRSVRKVKVHAQVTAVTKSKLGLTVGQKIYFEYESSSVPSGGWSGPRPMPLLVEGQSYDFFGETGDKNLSSDVVVSPVARGYSFEKVDFKE